MSRVVSRGTIRVDARKAVERLRGHQLLDLHSYVLEALRFAQASGARQINVEPRRDAIMLSWDGAPLGSDVLERLLDHLLVDPDQQELRRPRWLAYAVNAALGLGPEWVEVHSSNGSECTAVRWTPESGEAVRPEVRVSATPDGMPSPGMRLEVRRSSGWLSRLFSASELPKEVRVMQDSTRLLGARLQLDGRPFPHTPRPAPLVRAPFILPGARACWVEVTQWQSAAPTLEWYEQSVRLAASRWTPPPPFPASPHAGCELPVRVIIEAEELDTNASRSAIRQESHLLKELPAAAAEAFYAALHALACKVIGAPESESGIEFLSDNPGELENALGAAICVIAGSKGDGAMQGKLRKWLSLPLVRDAIGRPVPLAPYVGMGQPVQARYGDAPWPQELGPWVEDVLWLRGTTAEKAIDPARLRNADDRLDQARKAFERRTRFLARPAVGTRIEQPDDCLASVSRSLSEEPWEGLSYTVALLSRFEGNPFVARAIAEGRLLETFQLDSQSFPLPMLAAIEWPEKVMARADFDGVHRTEWLSRAIWVAAIEGVQLADAQAAGLSDGQDPARLRRLLRAAVYTLTRCTQALDLASVVETPSLESYASLWQVPIWPSSDGGFVSSRAVIELARTTGGVCLARSPRGPAADGRPVLVMQESELDWVRSQTNRELEFIWYDVALETPPGPERDAARRAEVDRLTGLELQRPPIWMRFERPGVIARIAMGERSLLTRLHAGQVVSQSAVQQQLGPVVLVLDDDGIVPRASWIGSLHFGSNPEIDIDIQVAFAEAVVDCLEGKGRSHPELEGVPSVAEHASPELVVWLLQAARRTYQTGDHVQLRSRIESLPLLQVIDENGNPAPASLYWIKGWHAPGTIPYIAQLPGFATMDWRPVLAPDGPVREALRELLGPMFVNANAELIDRARQARQEHAWVEWDHRPAVDPAEVLDALPGYPLAFARIPTSDRTGEQTVAGGVTAKPPTCARVLFRNREVRRLQWRDWAVPLSLTIGLAERKGMSSPGELSVQGLDAANLLGIQGRLLLAIELVRWAASGGGLPLDSNPLAIIASAVSDPAASSYPELDQALRSALAEVYWPTAQGGIERMRSLQSGAYGLRYCRVRFEPWHEPSSASSELDSPIAWIPPGEDGLRALVLLQTLYGAVEDATAMMTSLQARRAGTITGVPRLAGTPLHPLLRRGLEELGIRNTEGEMELADGLPEVMIADLGEGLQSIPWGREIPVRVMARVDDVLTQDRNAALQAELDRASHVLLGSSLQHLSELPDFVRAIARKLICSKLSRGQDLEAVEFISAVFPDTSARWHSIAEMSGTGQSWAFASDPPPHPSGERHEPVLWLTEGESGALRARVDLRDQTELLRRERLGELKLQQPPVTCVGIHGSLRPKCLFASPISGQGVEGEAGLLAPEHAGCRGIEVYVRRRLLCTLPDGHGYPIFAAVNCDSLVPNRYFDSPQTSLAGDELVARVRAMTADVARKWLISGRHAAAVRVVLQSIAPEAPLGPMHLVAVFWIPEQWPATPQCQVRSSLGSSSDPLRTPGSHELVDGIIPVCAEIYVFHEGYEHGADTAPYAWRQHVIVGRMALGALREMLQDTGNALQPAELEAWQWNLALLGDELPGLRASCVDGTVIPATSVATLLSSGRRVAIASQSSPFLYGLPLALVDNGQAACRVLRARARKGLDELASVPGRSSSAPTSWLDEIGTTLARALAGEKTGPSDPLETELSGALLRMLEAMRLTGSPVRAVKIASRGRAVRYRSSDGTLLVNTGHETLRDHLRSQPESALVMLATAALGEVNRELAAVTDREEADSLGRLLQQLASRPPMQNH